MEDELHCSIFSPLGQEHQKKTKKTKKNLNLHIQDEQNLQMQQDCWQE
jgi:hypothetical protein